MILFPSVLPSPQPSAQDDLLAALLTCDVIVYDIVEDQTQVEEASWAVQGEGGEREDRKKKGREERGRGTSITGIASAPSLLALFLGRGYFIPVVLMTCSSNQWKLGWGGG